MSATKNLNLAWKSPIVTWSSTYPKIRMGLMSLVWEVLSSCFRWMRSCGSACIVLQLVLAVLLCRGGRVIIGWRVAVHQITFGRSSVTCHVVSLLVEFWNYYKFFKTNILFTLVPVRVCSWANFGRVTGVYLRAFPNFPSGNFSLVCSLLNRLSSRKLLLV